ncbi:hypothetical protein NKI48_02950 [Mesorhizobium sp. M0644]|uniref:hypothetical protein n=1 Tax=Mesorhizobium sp. M0644 TaxID=2956979 RepID=UPI00333D6D6F
MLSISPKSYDEIFGNGWHVGGAEIRKRFTYVELTTSPVGVLVPEFIGQTAFDTVGKVYYTSTGLTANDWTASVAQGSVPNIYPTDAAVPGLPVPVGVDSFMTQGHATIGDKAGYIGWKFSSDEPGHLGKLYTQNNRWFEVMPNGMGMINALSMPGAGLGAWFNAARDAVLDMRESPVTSWFSNCRGIVIPPGLYDLDRAMELIACPNAYVYGRGAEIRNLGESFAGFKMINSPLAIIEGLKLNFRNNNMANEAFHIAGQNSWITLKDCGVQANSSNPLFAAARMQQGDVNGIRDGDAIDSGRNYGNFWVKWERFWTRTYSGGDLNRIPIGIDVQGCQNALRVNDCAFGNATTGILVHNQNSSLFSGGPNDIQIHQTAFEGGTGSAFKMIADGGASLSMSGGSMSQCRFEAIGAVAEVVGLSVSPQAPMTLVGNEVISSVPLYIIGDQNNFNVLDSIWTPAVSPRFLTRNGFQLPAFSGNLKAVLRLGPKGASDGGSIALERTDGVTIDGKLSQRSGGGMDIDGGTVGIVRAKDLRGLSGSTTHSANLRGTVAEPASGTTVAVTFANAEPDASYFILLQAPDGRDLWVTAASKTTAGFEISTTAAFAAGGNIVWMLIR